MKKLLVAVVCGLMALPPVTVAEDHGRGPPPPTHWNDGRRPAPQYYGGYRTYGYRGAYPRPVYVVRPRAYYRYPVRYPYYYYGHNNHSDNDDALWAIGGFVLGAILVGAAQQSAATPTASVSPAAAPPPGPAVNCYDDIVHDSAGNPHVQRHCYPVASP